MTQTAETPRTEGWPALPPYAEWKDTLATLHMWTQIVGKIRMALSPPVNHWWHVPLYVSARGLTTGVVPHGEHGFELEFDFIAHELAVRTSNGAVRALELRPRTVADFYGELMVLLRELGLPVRIRPQPQEVADPIPFDRDTTHAAYDPDAANRCWRALAQADRVLRAFRGRFIGKSSPVHFFWGSFDLAVTRFSGRRAPEHPGAPGVADSITREAYSHEASSAGFWPGSDAYPHPAFYAYSYPEPEGFRAASVRPSAAFYSADLGEWLLPYEAVRTAADPDTVLMEFLETTYAAGADLAGWDRAALER